MSGLGDSSRSLCTSAVAWSSTRLLGTHHANVPMWLPRLPSCLLCMRLRQEGCSTPVCGAYLQHQLAIAHSTLPSPQCTESNPVLPAPTSPTLAVRGQGRQSAKAGQQGQAAHQGLGQHQLTPGFCPCCSTHETTGWHLRLCCTAPPGLLSTAQPPTRLGGAVPGQQDVGGLQVQVHQACRPAVDQG